ncbi:MAG: SPOR domain-containing protein [Erythrobacter sp.]
MIIEAEYEDIESGETDEGELDLSEDDSLPWLEADEEDEGSGGVDTVRLIALFLILALLLFAIIGAIWHFSNRPSGDQQVADGSLIEAPDGPTKVRPDDPGGKEFEGTGNVAPVVGGGGTPEGVLNTDGSSAQGTGADAAGNGGNGSGAGGGSSSATTSTSGVGVQLAAYSSRARAEQGWNDLSRRTDALSGARYRIEEGTVDIGTVYRLQAVASDRAAADQLCAALKADGLDCQVKP